MRAIVFFVLSLLLPLGTLTQSAQADSALEFPPYTASYEAEFNGMDITATHSLTIVDGNYRIATSAKNFLGGIEESETFRLQSGRVVVNGYQYERSLLGGKRAEVLTVDHSVGLAHYTRKNKVREISLQENYLGPLSYQLQIRRDLLAGAKTFDYQVMHRGKVRDYRFEITGREILTTPAGDIECVTLRRIRDNNKRETQFWMAENMDYLLVKLRQKEDNETHELILSNVETFTSTGVNK